MAIGNVQLNDGSGEKTYEPVNIGGTVVLYRDTVNSTLALPEYLEIGHTPGSLTKPDRHLTKLSWSDDNADGTIIRAASVHVVWTIDRQIITEAQVTKHTTMLCDFMSTAAYRDAVIRGGFPS